MAHLLERLGLGDPGYAVIYAGESGRIAGPDGVTASFTAVGAVVS